MQLKVRSLGLNSPFPRLRISANPVPAAPRGDIASQRGRKLYVPVTSSWRYERPRVAGPTRGVSNRESLLPPER
jgi:hypothetical protein